MTTCLMRKLALVLLKTDDATRRAVLRLPSCKKLQR